MDYGVALGQDWDEARPAISDGPLLFFAENLGAWVEWNQGAGTVEIYI